MRLFRKIENQTRKDRTNNNNNNNTFRHQFGIRPADKIIEEMQLEWLAHNSRIKGEIIVTKKEDKKT